MATYTQALEQARRLKAIMERRGVRCSIELQAGRGTGGSAWMVTKYHRMWHHTVSRYSSGGSKTPVLWLVKQGRPDVPGPLANGYIGYDRVFRIITLGLANHPGRGGPVTIDGVRIPRDSARAPTFGIEVEGGYQRWEDIPGMLETMGRADVALAEWMGRPLTSQMEHLTWAPTRKIDRLGFNRARGIDLSRRWSGAGSASPKPEEGFLMALSDSQQKELFEMVKGLHLGRPHKTYGRDYIKANVEPRFLTLNQVGLKVIEAARFVRDEKPDAQVDLDEIARSTAEAARQAVAEALPAALAELTPDAVAAAVVDALPEDHARAVVDQLAARLEQD